MVKIRKAAVEGLFYPDNKELLDKTLDLLLSKAFDLEIAPKAIIAPHAGYIYSGHVVASAYKSLQKNQNKIKKVVLIGPSHRVSFSGLAAPKSDFFATPLGKIKIDQATIKSLNLLQIRYSDKAHESEHCLEVHLPFLQKILGNDFKLIPLVVGNSSAEEVSEVIEKFWDNDEILVVISTDLSHYHSYLEAYEIDKNTLKNIEDLQFEKLEASHLCGFQPVCGLLHLARKKQLQVKLVDFCNSGDIKINNQANKDRVVGYAAFYCDEAKKLGDFLSKAHKKELLLLARSIIDYALNHNFQLPKNIKTDLQFDLKTKAATFVTLEINGNLRGCIGTIIAHNNILQDVASNAFNAAFADPRFPQLTKEELGKAEISISILTKSEALLFESEADLLGKIQAGIDGLILSYKNHRATFLPVVWEDLPDKKDFLNRLKQKAGLQANFWSNDIKIEKYKAIKFGENDFKN